MRDVNERMECLERRFHELYRIARAARAELEMPGTHEEARWSLQRRVDEAEREKRAILREIETIEDQLIAEIS